jgi:Protein of unknown function (DUF3309)
MGGYLRCEDYSSPEILNRPICMGAEKFAEDTRVYTILIIILILLLIGALPTWPYSTGWGYYPSGGLGLVLIIILILALVGRA